MQASEVRSQVQTDRLTYLALAGGAITGLVAPFLLSTWFTPIAKVSTWLASSVAAGTLALLCSSDTLKEQQRRQRSVEKITRYREDSLLARQAQTQEMTDKAQHQIEVLAQLAKLPDWQRNKFLQELGWQDLAGLFAKPKPPAPESPEMVRQAKKLEVLKGEDEDSAYQLYRACRRQLLCFAGAQGEGKTNAAHFALWTWAHDPEDGEHLVIYVFDPHYRSGRDPRYISTWLGIPELKQVPKDGIETGVFQGDEATFYDWLQPIWSLYKLRKANGIAVHLGVEACPPVIFLPEEATNMIGLMDEVLAKKVKEQLSELATAAPKFGIYSWIIVHNLTESGTGLPRKYYEQHELIAGAALCGIKSQMSAAPRVLSAHTIEFAVTARRIAPSGVPCGYGTSLGEVPDGFLPPAPLNNLEMEMDWTGEAIDVESEEIEDSPAAEEIATAQPQPPKLTTADILKALQDWQAELQRPLTDEEIVSRFITLSGILPTDTTIAYFKRELGNEGTA